MMSFYKRYHTCSPLYCVPAESVHYSAILTPPGYNAEAIRQYIERRGGTEVVVKRAPEATTAMFAAQMPPIPIEEQARCTVTWIVICKAVLV